MTELETDIILKIFEQFPQGAKVEEVAQLLDPSYQRRTVQRRLNELIKKGFLYAEGHTRSRKYYLQKTSEKKIKLQNRGTLILSEKSNELCLKVRGPIETRQRVGYNIDFLESYIPDQTFYLPETTRRQLFEMGRTENGKYPAGTYARQIFNRLHIDLSWNSSRLEGNTYSLLETERLLEQGVMAEGKNAQETQMILNHKAAIEFLVDSAEELKINNYFILNLHALLADNLIPDGACGKIRSISIGIGKSVYTPVNIPQLVEDYFRRFLTSASAIHDPFEQAFFMMVHLPYLQPFEDVNKRTSRLAANIPLIKHNLCPLSFIDVPEDTYVSGLLGVYELNQIELLREVFIWAYERSCYLYSTTRRTVGEPDPFRIEYRSAIIETVAQVIQNQMDQTQAIYEIKKQAEEKIPSKDQARFVEIVEREIQDIHEGSIARYKIRPSEYKLWKENWK